MEIKTNKLFKSVVIITALTKEMLEKLEKHMEKTLALYNEDGEQTFRITFDKESFSGCVSNYGIVFNTMLEDGRAVAIAKVDDVKQLDKAVVAEKYAVTLRNLRQIEAQAASAYVGLQAELLEVSESIVEEAE